MSKVIGSTLACACMSSSSDERPAPRDPGGASGARPPDPREPGERPKATLGTGELFALGVNGIVGVGIFFAPAEIAAKAPGLAGVVVFAVTGLAMVPIAFAMAKLGAHIHEDGAAVLYARRAFGERAGFFVGWMTYVSSLLSTSAVLVGLTRAVLGETAPRWVAAAMASALALLCALGLKASARVWTFLTVLKLVPLFVLAALVTWHAPPPHASPGIAHENDWLRACLTATFVFQGFEIVPLLSGQARRPARSMPIAVIGSLLFATGLYLLLQRGAVLALPNLAGEGEPLVATASAFGSDGVARLVRVGTSVSALGIAFGMVTTTPRYLSALALGTALEREHRNVPLRALAVTWALLVVLVLGLGELGELLALSSLAVVIQFLVVACTLLRLSRSRQYGLRPRDGWPALPTIVIALVLLSAASRHEWLIATSLLALGAVFYLVYRRIRTQG